MTDKTTDTLRMSMRQIVDMTPAAPNLPAIPERRSVARPVLALAGGFAAVLLFVGVFWTVKFSFFSPAYIDHQTIGFALAILLAAR